VTGALTRYAGPASAQQRWGSALMHKAQWIKCFALPYPTPELLSSVLQRPCRTAESDVPGPKLLQVAMEYANILLIFINDSC